MDPGVGVGDRSPAPGHRLSVSGGPQVRAGPPKMMYPLVRDLAVTGILVTVVDRVLGFSTQTLYQWCAQPVCDRKGEEFHLLDVAYEVRADGAAMLPAADLFDHDPPRQAHRQEAGSAGL